MNKLYIKETVDLPEIDFNPDTNILKLKGMSYPDNALEFYKPIFEWLEEYIDKVANKTVVEINISYLNTSSTKSMLNILDIFENARKTKKEIVVNWYYEDGDEELKECAEEFKEDYELEFNIIPL